MSGAINLLEALGARAASGVMEAAAAGAALPAAEYAALVAGDAQALAVLLGARTSLVCAIVAPDDATVPDEQQERPDDRPDDIEPQAA